MRRCGVVLALLGPALAALAALPTLPADGWGVNIHATSFQAGELAQLAQAFRVVRTDLTWQAVENDCGVFDFSAYDDLVSELVEGKSHRPVRPYLILDYGNACYDGGESPRSDEGRRAFARFAVAAVARYARYDVVWELWNEPNMGHWDPRRSSAHYAALAKEVDSALRTAGLRHNTTFVGPALATAYDMLFLEALKAEGALGVFDAISVHPYRPFHPETALKDYAVVRGIVANASVGLICGEWGYSTCRGACAPAPVTGFSDEAKQARYLARQFLGNCLANTSLSIYYDWVDDGTDVTQREQNFGVLHNAYVNSSLPHVPKPAFTAAATLQRVFGGRAYTGRLPAAPAPAPAAAPRGATMAAASDVFVVGFAGPVLAVWTTNEDSRGVAFTVAVAPSLCFALVSHLGEGMGTKCADANGVLEGTATDSPVYFVGNQTARLGQTEENRGSR